MSWTRVQASPSACAGVAQSAEQSPCKRKVAGSNPVTSPRMRSRKCAVSDRGVTDKRDEIPTLWYEFESRRAAPQIPARRRSNANVV